jgi:hypothetical protein
MHLRTADARMSAWRARNWDLTALGILIGVSVRFGLSRGHEGDECWSLGAWVGGRIREMVAQSFTELVILVPLSLSYLQECNSR